MVQASGCPKEDLVKAKLSIPQVTKTFSKEKSIK